MEMESGDQMAKKARMELLNQVKQEVAVGERNGRGGAIVAAEVEDASRVDITLKFDMALLHCHVCVLPLKPPVFLCEAAGHVACASCHGKLPGKRCHAFSNGRAYVRCPAMDNVVSADRIPCPYDQHGCRSYVAYHEVGGHQSVCPYAPCSCTDPGCVFVGGPPAALLAHLTTVHSWPVHNIHYGKALRLGVPASRIRVLLVEEDSGGMFLLAVGELGPARAISLVCVRANAGAGPSYTCKLWAHAPQDAATGKSAFILMDSTVMSSAAPGEILMDEVKFLAVPPVMLHGAEPSKEMHLSVRIHKTS